VVPMGTEHIDGVWEIEKLAFTTPWSKDAFNKEMTDNHFAFYLAVLDNDKVVAYVGSWIILDECHITNIAVHPNYKRQGISYKLMRILMDTVKVRGVESVTLEVRKTNYTAQNLYKKLGFEDKGIRKSYYTDNNEDAIIMWANI
jgi:[ribosomal protein S18]-alanine N-acetyltransferase